MIDIPEEVKQLFKQDSIRKNFRVHFPNGERADITNENIVAESVSLTESLCSQDTLKFGLCESSTIDFETVGIENIKGCQIECSIEIDISSLDEDFITENGSTSNDVGFPFYPVTYGKFTIKECPRQTNMEHRKVTAYGKKIDSDSEFSQVEIGKYNGSLSTTIKNDYTFDIPKVCYANNPGKNLIFDDVEELELQTVTDVYSGFSYFSYPDIDISWMKKENCYFTFIVSFQYKYYGIQSQEDAKNLFYMKYDDANRDVCLGIKYQYNYWIGRLKGNPSYREKNCTPDILVDIAKYGFYREKGDYGSVVELGEHQYVYPYMCYSDKETQSRYSSGGQAYPTSSHIGVPYKVRFTVYRNGNGYLTADTNDPDYKEYHDEFTIRNKNSIHMYRVNLEDSMPMTLKRKLVKIGTSEAYAVDGNDMDFASLFDSFCELNAYFGRYSRFSNEYELYNIQNRFGLYPSEELYPSEDLYPRETTEIADRSLYISAWYDDVQTKKYSKVTCTYKDADGNDVYAESVIEIEDGIQEYQPYDISDNYIIQNCTLTSQKIQSLLDDLASKIKNIQYMPADIDLKGLPYIEAGDTVNVLTKTDGFETIVLRRTLSGIQSLKDNYESKGE